MKTLERTYVIPGKICHKNTLEKNQDLIKWEYMNTEEH